MALDPSLHDELSEEEEEEEGEEDDDERRRRRRERIKGREEETKCHDDIVEITLSKII